MRTTLLLGEVGEPAPASCDQDEVVALSGQDAGELEPDSAGGTCDQGERHVRTIAEGYHRSVQPIAGIVLAGGRSERMGRPKATLDWHGRTLVEHVVEIITASVEGPVIVVCAPGQKLPAIAGVEIAIDAAEGRGPLEGIAAGFRALTGRAEAAFVSSTDVPFLQVSFVRRIVTELDRSIDAVLPTAGGRVYPLSGVYRVSVLPEAEALLAAGRFRASLLAERVRTRYLDAAELLADPELANSDPELRSLVDVNDPAAYRQATKRSDAPDTET